LGLWDFRVEALGMPWAHSVQTSVGILLSSNNVWWRKTKSKQTFTFSSNSFVLVLQLRSPA